MRGGEGGMHGSGVCVVGVCMAGGPCVLGVCVQGGRVCWGCACHARPPVDRQTGIKTLPCPKLRLRAVKIYTLFTTSFQ